MVFSAVGTPPDEDGSADLSYVLEVARTIGRNMQKYVLVVTKSTVPVGTARKVRATIQEELNKRGMNIDFDVASNPEFLKEGNAINDFMSPDIKVRDSEGIQLANAKIDEIRNGFSEWLEEQSPQFKERLTTMYNRKFNCFVRPKYDGSHQTFPDLNLKGLANRGIRSVYPSQMDCVWMLKQNGGGICDHEVGTGKTLIMCIAAHEMKRLNLAHKPMIIGLKANVAEIAASFQLDF